MGRLFGGVYDSSSKPTAKDAELTEELYLPLSVVLFCLDLVSSDRLGVSSWDLASTFGRPGCAYPYIPSTNEWALTDLNRRPAGCKPEPAGRCANSHRPSVRLNGTSRTIRSVGGFTIGSLW